MSSPTYFTRKSLAAACGLSVKQIDVHTRAGTLRLNQARDRVPGLGVIFKAGLCERFVAAMQAKHAAKIEAAKTGNLKASVEPPREGSTP